MPHKKEKPSKGHHVCARCGGYIRPERGERIAAGTGREKVHAREVNCLGKNKEKAATGKAKAKKVSTRKVAEKVSSPLRKVILSRNTVQVTIPSHVRDEALKSVNLSKPGDLKGWMAKVEWDSANTLITVTFVPGEEKTEAPAETESTPEPEAE